MEFDDGTTPSIGNPDEGVEDPTSLWESNCGATEK